MGKGKAPKDQAHCNPDVVSQGAMSTPWIIFFCPFSKYWEAPAKILFFCFLPQMISQHSSGHIILQRSDFQGPQVLRKMLWSVRGSGMSTGHGVRELYSRLAWAPDSYVILTQSLNLSGPVSLLENQRIGVNQFLGSFSQENSRFQDSVKKWPPKELSQRPRIVLP